MRGAEGRGFENAGGARAAPVDDLPALCQLNVTPTQVDISNSSEFIESLCPFSLTLIEVKRNTKKKTI